MCTNEYFLFGHPMLTIAKNINEFASFGEKDSKNSDTMNRIAEICILQYKGKEEI